MKFSYLISCFVFVQIYVLSSQAFMLDLNGNMFQDAQTTATDSKSAKTFIGVAALGDIAKSDVGTFHLGWSIISMSQKTDVGTTSSESFSSLDMGPEFRWAFDKKGLFSVSLVYGVLAKGTYQSGVGSSTSETVSGTNLFFKFAIEPEISERWHLGFAMNYYSVQYKLSVVNSVETSVSYKNTWTFPSISATYRY